MIAPTSEISHQDKLGRNLAVGHIVTFSHHNHLYIGQITRLTPKMIRVKFLAYRTNVVVAKYPNDVIQLDDSDVSWYLLKNG